MPLYLNRTNVVVGGSTALGDNGVGEVQFTNAASVPTTNPTGGVVVYSQNGGLYIRDPNGTVSSIVSTLRTGATSFGAIAETINHNAATSLSALPSGELEIMSVGIEAGQLISNIGFCTASTAAVGPTHWWATLLDKNLVQQAHSADQLTAAIPANTWQLLPMVTPYRTTYTGLYYIGIMIATTVTQPTVIASNMPAVFVTGSNLPAGGPVGGRSSTGLTGPGTDGVTQYTTPTTLLAGGFYHAYAI